VLHGFGQAKFADCGSILDSSQLSILSKLPPITMPNLKVVKIDSNIIISFLKSKHVIHPVNFYKWIFSILLRYISPVKIRRTNVVELSYSLSCQNLYSGQKVCKNLVFSTFFQQCLKPVFFNLLRFKATLLDFKKFGGTQWQSEAPLAVKQ